MPTSHDGGAWAKPEVHSPNTAANLGEVQALPLCLSYQSWGEASLTLSLSPVDYVENGGGGGKAGTNSDPRILYRMLTGVASSWLTPSGTIFTNLKLSNPQIQVLLEM